MARINEIDRRVLEALPGSEKIKTLLKEERGLELKDFARKHSEWVENVSACIRGVRPLPEVRDLLAAELEMSRADIDALIDGAPAKRVG